jgi:hypothetical protein
MKKSTKIMLGLGALAVVGYFIYKNNQDDKKSTGVQTATGKKGGNFPCKGREVKYVGSDGYTTCTSGNSVPTVFDPNGNQIR